MKTHSLTAAIRTELGKKVKLLRKAGQIPATVYGKTMKSISVTVSQDAFEGVYAKAGETGLVELAVGNEKRPVLVHSVQRNALSDAPLHVEFHQVDLKEKVHAKVSIEITGVSPAVAQKLGVLLTVLDAIEVEALPTHLPEKITVDVGILAEVNQELKVSDLSMGSDITVLTDAALTVVKVGPLVTREAEAQAAAEAEAAQAAATTAEGAQAAEAAEAKPEAEKPATEAKPPEEKKA